MQLTTVDMDEVLEQSKGQRGRPRIFSDENVEQAIAMVKSGIESVRNTHVSSDATYDSKEQARSHALKLRELMIARSDLTEDDLTTKVWVSVVDNRARWAVSYMAPVPHKLR